MSVSVDVYSKMHPNRDFKSKVIFRRTDPHMPIRVDKEYAKPKGPNSSTWSDKTTRWAKNCLALCSSEHIECSLSSTPSWVPSRLLFIGELDNKGGYHTSRSVRIVARSNVPKGCAYTTLSHCWGKSHTLCLTTSSLEQFAEGIPFSSLPKTYAEAITVTKDLGFQYIWIDSLCIIQDSKSDWEAECGQMSLVYTNGIINIAALHSKDSHGGCISGRDSTLLEPLVVESTWMPHKTYNYVFPEEEHIFPVLYTRGWILQERLLSPRILQFGENVVHWQCRVSTQTECSMKASPSPLRLAIFASSPKPGQALGGARSLFELQKSWGDLVMDYTKTALTRPEDKLPAFSGVAKVFGSLLRETTGREFSYLAGLWEPLLKEQLLWYSLNKVIAPQPSSRPLAYRAPSWSWAAIDGTVSVNGYLDIKGHRERWLKIQYFIEILGTGVAPVADNDVYLRVSGGYIKLLCWLWRIDHRTPSNIRTWGKELELSVKFFWDVEVLDSAEDVVYFMPIVIEPRSWCYQVHGLLLIQQRDQFERRGIGMITTTSAHEKPRIRAEVIQCLEEVVTPAFTHGILESRDFKGEFSGPHQNMPDGGKRDVKRFWRRHVITIV
jgi:hypothetical protein